MKNLKNVAGAISLLKSIPICEKTAKSIAKFAVARGITNARKNWKLDWRYLRKQNRRTLLKLVTDRCQCNGTEIHEGK